MRHHAPIWLVLIVVGAVLLPGCRTSSMRERNPAEAPWERVDPGSTDPAEAHARFAAGVSLELNNEPERALEQFYLAALADPANEPLIIEVARRFIQRGDNEKAVELLSRSARRPEASGEVFVWLGRGYLVQGRNKAAVAASRQAIARSPSQIGGYQNLAEAHLQMDQPESALDALNQAAAQAEDDVLFLISLAAIYGNYLKHHPEDEPIVKSKAVAVLDRVDALNPRNPNLLHKLADTYQLMGDTGKAAEIYLQILSDHSDIPFFRDVVREKLADLFLQTSDKERAAEQLRAMIRDTPTRYPHAYYMLGSIAYEQREWAAAEEYFTKALLLTPGFEPAYYDLAGVQISADRPEDALKTLGNAVSEFGKSFAAEFLFGLAYSRMENHAQAIRHYTAAEIMGRATDPGRLNHFFYFQFGAALERTKDYEAAADYFKKAIEISPDFAEALNYLGYMWADLDVHLDEAYILIRRAVELDPENAAFLDSLGWVLFRLGRHEEALDYLLRALDLMEEPDPILFDHLGDIYLALGEVAKAREAWQESLLLEPNEDIESKIEAAGERNGKKPESRE